MARRIIRCWVGSVVCALVLAWAAGANAQPEIGHKFLGTIGFEAGTQPDPGIYLVDRFFFYRANELIDRSGQTLQVGLDLNVAANGVGAAGILQLPGTPLYWNVGLSAPVASVSIQTERPEASLDNFGLGDFYFQPVKIGWRGGLVDLVTGYALYLPSTRQAPGGVGGVGRGQVTHELSLGGTVHFDHAQTWQLSALASYEVNERKPNIDITRGNTLQIQGGASKSLFGFVDLGVIGYGLWQTTDDRGSDLPAVLSGARDQVFGVGPEVDFTIRSLRSRVTLRYAHDITVTSRALGQIFLVGWTVWAAQPAAPAH